MEAHKWFKNGDHPEDGCTVMQGGDGLQEKTGEGKVVRYFRHPGIPVDTLCTRCGHTMYLHGWIDKSHGGQVACPCDLIIKNEQGEWEVFRKDWEYDNRKNEASEKCQETPEKEQGK